MVLPNLHRVVLIIRLIDRAVSHISWAMATSTAWSGKSLATTLFDRLILLGSAARGVALLVDCRKCPLLSDGHRSVIFCVLRLLLN